MLAAFAVLPIISGIIAFGVAVDRRLNQPQLEPVIGEKASPPRHQKVRGGQLGVKAPFAFPTQREGRRPYPGSRDLSARNPRRARWRSHFPGVRGAAGRSGRSRKRSKSRNPWFSH